MGGGFVADLVEPGEVLLRRFGGQFGLGSFRSRSSVTLFLCSTIICEGPSGRPRTRTGTEKPFVQTISLAFEAGEKRPKTSFVQVAPELGAIKPHVQGGHI